MFANHSFLNLLIPIFKDMSCILVSSWFLIVRLHCFFLVYGNLSFWSNNKVLKLNLFHMWCIDSFYTDTFQLFFRVTDNYVALSYLQNIKRQMNASKELDIEIIFYLWIFKMVPMENLNGRKLVEAADLCERRNGMHSKELSYEVYLSFYGL